jgi:hypothetical protein
MCLNEHISEMEGKGTGRDGHIGKEDERTNGKIGPVHLTYVGKHVYIDVEFGLPTCIGILTGET